MSDDEDSHPVIDSAYIFSSLLFILSLSGLSHQETARRGNFYGVTGMTLAILSTMFLPDFANFFIFVLLMGLGGTIGSILALKVEMIQMPQLVAMLHSFVGLAASLVGFANFYKVNHQQTAFTNENLEIYLGIFIGNITFTGSVVAFGKLHGKITSTPLLLGGEKRHMINAGGLGVCVLLLIIFLAVGGSSGFCLVLMTLISGFLGWNMVMAIGGADMPVVVSMLNSYSGWATCAGGFMLKNNLLIITGSLVGSSGAILSYIMCKAMNRSFISVILGGFGQGTSSSALAMKVEGEAVETKVDEVVQDCLAANRIVLVPGFGMAQARCQEQVANVVAILRKMGKHCKFCIHPVAGRLPGHMNVLLAEANVPYDIVMEMDEINDDFPTTDLVMIIGANDIVNPAALEDPNSPIAGMPVCEVWKAKKVIVLKRGLATGYAGIDNPLFFKENTRMFFGNALTSMKDLLNGLSEKSGTSVSTSSSTADLEGGHREQTSEDEIVVDIDRVPSLTIGVPKETHSMEKRIALVPKHIPKFRKLGFAVQIEDGAGEGSGFTNETYERVGATIVDTKTVWNDSDLIFKVREPMYNSALGCNEDDAVFNGKTSVYVSYMKPYANGDIMDKLAARDSLTVIGMDCVPRITRAQKLDSLSSMGNIAGYRAVIEGFHAFQKYSKGQMTAAGKQPPARVFVVGAGVAGLAAIGTARGLGAVVKAFDTRPVVKEQVESMGAEFVEVDYQEDGTGVGGYAKEMSEGFKQAQQELFCKICRKTDIIITTALIPGRPAPIILNEEATRAMKAGSVIVDLAAENGGNCAFTKKDERYVFENGVTIIGYTDLVSRMGRLSSEMYSMNLYHLTEELCGTIENKESGAESLNIDLDDEIQASMVCSHGGKMTWVAPHLRPQPAKEEKKPSGGSGPSFGGAQSSSQGAGGIQFNDFQDVRRLGDDGSLLGRANVMFGIDKPFLIRLGGTFFFFLILGLLAGEEFVRFFLAFVLGICIGWKLIWNVTPALHTPLMSVTNAISGIIVVGAMLQLDSEKEGSFFAAFLGAAGLFFASINVFGGFIVTQRMLAMFKK
eukprot:CAMPEP_0115019500 /NCGR_PEP_ID=MMETSP0216-20121206/29489_1 /TAXON_ID=223996 /ORGANISM="Protocruzia adherens, Strain Boccale" /LENGTH=1068 /DNA_ID=CAMNT_0002390999 /DNA_START=153 /DNA_END=3359 /DNA_ORIENTATION=-